MVILC